ncbi:hypothetical protein Tco_1137979 [Tanacetum coccineum]
MMTLKFADTHNMVTFLSKPAESDRYEQIMDFLNAQPIRYGLTVNPTIYISCIKQFWSTGMIKTINRESQLHALVDGKKINISEAFVRRDLKLEDDPKTTAWNEFSSTMASAIIYLATNQKFNFSKHIFEKLGEGSANLTDPHHTPTITQLSTSQPQKTQKPRKPKRKNTQVPQPSGSSDNVTDKAVHKELGNSLVRAATTASSLEAEHDNGNITKTLSKATYNESSSLGTTSGGGPSAKKS